MKTNLVTYSIHSGDEKPETPYKGPGTYSPAEMDIKIRVIDEKEKVCKNQNLFTEQI